MIVSLNWLYRYQGSFVPWPSAIRMINLGFYINYLQFGIQCRSLDTGIRCYWIHLRLFQVKHLSSVDCLGPFLSKDCIMYTMRSLWWSTTTNNLDLWLSWILLWSSGWSLNSTKFPTGIWIVLPPVLDWLFLALCLICFNAHLFGLISSSCCSFNHAHLLVETWSL